MLVLFKKIVLALFILLIASQAQAQMRIWKKTTADEKSRTDFLLNMQTNGHVKNGELLVDGLCDAAFNGVPNKTIADKTEFCKMFVYQNVLEGKSSLTVDEFVNHVWIVPDNATVAAYNAQQNKAPTAVAGLNTLPVVAEKPAQAIKQTVDIGTLETRLSALTKQAQGNVQAMAEVQQLRQSVGALKSRMNNLENGELTAQMQSSVVGLMESKLADIYKKLDTLTAGQNDQNGRLNGLENNLLALDKRVDEHDTQLQAALPLSFDLIKAIVGEKAVYNYVVMAKYIQGALFIVVVAIVIFFYPFFFVRLRSSNVKLEKKVEQVAQQVAGMVEYTFDPDLVSRDILQKDIPKVGNSLRLNLTATDGGEDIVLEIVRSKDNEITIKGAYRRIGSKESLVCGLNSVPKIINRAIFDGRVEGINSLQAVA